MPFPFASHPVYPQSKSVRHAWISGSQCTGAHQRGSVQQYGRLLTHAGCIGTAQVGWKPGAHFGPDGEHIASGQKGGLELVVEKKDEADENENELKREEKEENEENPNDELKEEEEKRDDALLPPVPPLPPLPPLPPPDGAAPPLPPPDGAAPPLPPPEGC